MTEWHALQDRVDAMFLQRQIAETRGIGTMPRVSSVVPQFARHTTPTFNPVSPASRTVGTETPTSVNCAVHCSSQ